ALGELDQRAVHVQRVAALGDERHRYGHVVDHGLGVFHGRLLGGWCSRGIGRSGSGLDGPRRVPARMRKPRPPRRRGSRGGKAGGYLRASSFMAFAMRNLSTRFAGILMASPVCGLRPMRALRFTTISLPTPGNTKPDFACFAARFASSSRIIVLCFLVISNL